MEFLTKQKFKVPKRILISVQLNLVLVLFFKKKNKKPSSQAWMVSSNSDSGFLGSLDMKVNIFQNTWQPPSLDSSRRGTENLHLQPNSVPLIKSQAITQCYKPSDIQLNSLKQIFIDHRERDRAPACRLPSGQTTRKAVNQAEHGTPRKLAGQARNCEKCHRKRNTESVLPPRLNLH